MKSYVFILLFLALCTSCKEFPSKKISSEEFLKQELQTLNWNDIDAYPLFPECSENDPKDVQRTCFETTILRHIEGYLQDKALSSKTHLEDTVYLQIKINREGMVSLPKTTGDTTTFNALPKLKNWLESSVAVLPKMNPALKRGTPVQTQFTLPVVIATQ